MYIKAFINPILAALLDLIYKLCFVVAGFVFIGKGEIIEGLLCIMIIGIACVIDKLDNILEEMKKPRG